MEGRNQIFEIVGAIAGFLLVIAIVNVAVDQVNTDRQQLAEEFDTQLLMREADGNAEPEAVEVAGDTVRDEAAPDEAAPDEAATEDDDLENGMTTQGTGATDIELTSPELPGGPENEVDATTTAEEQTETAAEGEASPEATPTPES